MEYLNNTNNDKYSFEITFDKTLNGNSIKELKGLFYYYKNKKDIISMKSIYEEVLMREAILFCNNSQIRFDKFLSDFKYEYYEDIDKEIRLFLLEQDRIKKYQINCIDDEYFWDFYSFENIVNDIFDESDRQEFIEIYMNYLIKNIELAFDLF